MKHLFFVNNHTSFLSAVGTVEYLNLSANEVVFFAARHYKNSLMSVSWVIYDISDIFGKYTDYEIWRDRSKRKEYINNIDNLIWEKIGENYKFYCCHYAHPGLQMIYTHSLCVEGSYIQEGGVPFKNTYVTDLPIEKRFFNWCVNNLYLRTNRCHYPVVWFYPGFHYKQKEIHSYAISDTFFKYLPSINHIIKWPSHSININIEKDSTIFIFDGFVFHGLCEYDFYLLNCKRLINEESSKTNYLRFHPSQSDVEKKSIIDCFIRKGHKYEIMDPSIPFEWVLTSSKEHLKVVGFGSSLLFFSRDYGHHVVCRDEWLADSPSYQKYKKENGFLWFRETCNLL